MNPQELSAKISQIIDEAKAAVMATVDEQGIPQVRWITPGCLKDRPDALYMISGKKLGKIAHIQHNPNITLLVQTPALDKIVTIHGAVNIIENPTLQTEVLECVGKHLTSFWKVNPSDSELVVLEMVFRDAVYYEPAKGIKVRIDFAGGN